MLVQNLDFWGTYGFQEILALFNRNSYRYRKSHIYETVKLYQINLVDYSESEKRYKAFTEHGSD